MRLSRYEYRGTIQLGFYFDNVVVGLADAAKACGGEVAAAGALWSSVELMRFLPPDGDAFGKAQALAKFVDGLDDVARARLSIPADHVRLLAPIARPTAIFLLAGNYAAHIEEGGKKAAARQETFPYVFMKPPTTVTNPGDPVKIPAVSPHSIDWECELGVVIGRSCKNVSEADALKYVAGYTVVNDISDRKFRPNPGRSKRDNDQFFDWLHGKWHDTFCPFGPCIRSADSLIDPQTLTLELRVNGSVKQHANTALMIFPVAAVIEFISSFVTLEPGDIISTGTPAGVGSATGTFLKRGDLLEAEISGIGLLRNPVM
jgi:2-keto-4-pentenoate hydratase/2-oxohepta-3-ene-1,7-dioic acid hydratase in catechol pathway